MSSSDDSDISNLTTSQQEALQQFVAVTDQNIAQAIPILRRSEWNVQVRIKLLTTSKSDS